MMNIAWIYLLAASLFEIGWPMGYKIAEAPGKSLIGFGISILCMIASGYLLFLAQKDIPIGTAYAIWTGIGAAGTFLLGIYLFEDPVSIWRLLGAFLIVSGVVVLKMTH